MIGSSGYEAAFFWFGIGQGLVVVLVSFFFMIIGVLPLGLFYVCIPYLIGTLSDDFFAWVEFGEESRSEDRRIS